MTNNHTNVYFIKEMLFESVTSNACTTSTRIDKLQFATPYLCSKKNDIIIFKFISQEKFLLSSIIMIAEGTGKNIWVTNTIVHPTIPSIDISSHKAILSGMAWGMAAVKPPTSVFITIVMITNYSVKDIVGSTLRIERLIKPIHITCPIAMIPW